MAQDAPKSAWGFWNSIVETVTTTVKHTSDEIYNVYKEDLQEFSRTIVADTSAVIKDKVDMFSAHDKGAAHPSPSASNKNTHAHARVLRMQRDPKTYNEEPTDDSGTYSSWSATFNVGAPENTEAITLLLTSNETVREFHTALVPTKVLYRDFWCRYYYRIHQLEEEEKRRAAILKNANDDDDEFSWDVEDDTNSKTAGVAPAPKASPILTAESTAPSSSLAPPSPSLSPSPTPTPTLLSSSTPPSPSPSASDAPVNVASLSTTLTPASLTPNQTTDTTNTQLEQHALPHQSPDAAADGTDDNGDDVDTHTASDNDKRKSPSSFEEVLSKDEIDKEIARKFELQKIEIQADDNTNNNSNKKKKKGGVDSPTSDAEEGWADWE